MRKVLLVIGGCLLVGIGLLTAITTPIVVFILPESFASTARILTGVKEPFAIATEVEKIQSKQLLFQVITNLNLNNEWAKKFKEDGDLRTDLTYTILRSKVQVGQAGKSLLIEVKAYSDDKNEAAAIANEIVTVYRESSLAIRTPDGKSAVQIIDKADPSLRPSRPNKALDIAAGCGAGAIAAILGAGLLVLSGRANAAFGSDRDRNPTG